MLRCVCVWGKREFVASVFLCFWIEELEGFCGNLVCVDLFSSHCWCQMTGMSLISLLLVRCVWTGGIQISCFVFPPSSPTTLTQIHRNTITCIHFTSHTECLCWLRDINESLPALETLTLDRWCDFIIVCRCLCMCLLSRQMDREPCLDWCPCLWI